MATLSNGLPFKLTFFQNDQAFPMTEFSQSYSANLEPIVKIRENINLEVLFESDNEEARLYMDGLDMLPERFIELDETRMAYLQPSDQKIILFKNHNDYYPLIPGFYRVHVVVQEVEYHTLIQVIPKQVTQEQWEIMRDELETELRGLAQDLIRKNLGIGDSGLNGLPVEKIQRFLVIEKHYPSAIASLNDLLTKVNSRIRKDYRLVPTERAKAIDQATIRHRLTHPENTTSLKTPVRDINYDLEENQWVCHFVRVVSNDLDGIIKSLEDYSDIIYEELRNYKYDGYDHVTKHNDSNVSAYVREKRKMLDTLSAFMEKAKKMKLGLQLIKLAPWYPDVSQVVSKSIPPVLKYDPRYRALYQFYRDLRSNEFEIELDSSYAYQWKRTDRLYEMWGYLKLCKTLTNKLGYTASSGWLFSSHFDGKHLLIPTLPANTKIVLEKENLRLHLIYNAVLPPKSEETDADVLCLNTQFHDTPDSRIDVYQSDVYIGTIVIDFKYRPLRGFWDTSKKTNSGRPSTTNQLIFYRSDSTSSHLFGNHISESMRKQLRPVLEVWAIYPTGKEEPIRFDEQHSVRLVQVCPGEPIDHLTQELMDGVERVRQFYQEYTERRESPISN